MSRKPLSEQVLVITGASSGIGLATAKMAARRGARVVLAARSEDDLRKAVNEIQEAECEASYVVTDVTREEDVRHLAAEAERLYGRIDTWVNNAGVSIYGTWDQVPMAYVRNMFDTNFWGLVYGSIEAARRMRDRGGAIVNVGSVTSDRAIPVQGFYSASKHAVKGFTDAFRMELEKDRVPVSVSLVKPSSIATPFPEHALNFREGKPSLPPPVYDPDVVAETILHCAEDPVREIEVGAGGLMISKMGNLAPRLTDRIMEMTLFRQQRQRGGRRSPNMERPAVGTGRERGDIERPVFRRSLYTKAALHPVATGLTVMAAGAMAFLLTRR